MLIAGIVDLGRINGFRVEAIEKPSRLSELEQEILVRDLNTISVDAFNKPTPLEETRERTVGVDTIFLIKSGTEVVGYTTNDRMTLDNHAVNYFSSALFKRKVQQEGLYQKVNDLRVEFQPSDNIMTRTQNPLVVQGFRSLCQRHGFLIHPDSANSTPEPIIRIARAYAPLAGEDLICRGVYGRALMDETPVPRENVRELFQRMNIPQGDAVILIGTKYIH